MRLLTTNGMDVKGMKVYTNPSKQDVQRWPSEPTGVSPSTGVYEYCQIMAGGLDPQNEIGV